MQHEIKSERLCILIDDGSFRNRKFYNRIQKTVAKTKVPKWFDSETFKNIIKKVNEIIKNKAYVNYNYNIINGDKFDDYIYFISEEDALAFKMKWG